MVLARLRVVAMLPDPHQLIVVAAAAALVHRQLGTRAQAHTVCLALSYSFIPRQGMAAAADSG